MNDKLLVHQRIGYAGLAVMLIAISALSALSMDMFSPSVPTITEEFAAPKTTVTLTITIFFVFYSVGMLLFGTASDKYGRKPVLVLCLVLFIAGSFLCAVSMNLSMLIGCRVIQAIGGGGAAAVGTALLKDVFAPEPREKFLMIMAVFQVVGPVAAPIMGAYIATASSWHMVFVTLGIIGAVCLAMGLLFIETLPKEQRITESVFSSYKHMVPILKNGSFTVFMIATIMPGVAFGGVLAVGSYIFQDTFGLSETAFGYFFAAIAVLGMFGPMLYGKVARKFSRRKVIVALMVLPALSFVLIPLFGHANPFAFTACFLPVILSSASARPAMTAILLQQNEDDAGSASGLINFANAISGAIGMAIASLFVFDFIAGLGILAGIAAAVSIAMWAVFCKKKMSLKGL